MLFRDFGQVQFHTFLRLGVVKAPTSSFWYPFFLPWAKVQPSAPHVCDLFKLVFLHPHGVSCQLFKAGRLDQLFQGIDDQLIVIFAETQWIPNLRHGTCSFFSAYRRKKQQQQNEILTFAFYGWSLLSVVVQIVREFWNWVLNLHCTGRCQHFLNKKSNHLVDIVLLFFKWTPFENICCSISAVK